MQHMAIKTKDFIFIFYNGNSFGKTGFGVISGTNFKIWSNLFF